MIYLRWLRAIRYALVAIESAHISVVAAVRIPVVRGMILAALPRVLPATPTAVGPWDQQKSCFSFSRVLNLVFLENSVAVEFLPS
jgi:hypothetical protein